MEILSLLMNPWSLTCISLIILSFCIKVYGIWQENELIKMSGNLLGIGLILILSFSLLIMSFTQEFNMTLRNVIPALTKILFG